MQILSASAYINIEEAAVGEVGEAGVVGEAPEGLLSAASPATPSAPTSSTAATTTKPEYRWMLMVIPCAVACAPVTYTLLLKTVQCFSREFILSLSSISKLSSGQLGNIVCFFFLFLPIAKLIVASFR